MVGPAPGGGHGDEGNILGGDPLETVRRLQLPSGGWWEMETRPRWGHRRLWALPGRLTSSQARPSDRALVALTTAWSFDEPVSLATLRAREAADLGTALDFMGGEIIGSLVQTSLKTMAEELFVGLAGGQVPPSFVEARLMVHTGWSWQTLMETPADVVERVAVYIAVSQAMVTGSALQIEEDEHDR